MEDSSTIMRELVLSVGGPLEAGENRKGWLSRVARRAGISYRVAAAAFYGEQLSSATEQKLRKAAAKHEPGEIATRLEYLAQSLLAKDADFYCQEVDWIRHSAHQLRRLRDAS